MSGPQTIGEIARWRAELDADAEAVVEGGRRLSWATLTERTNRLANALRRELGVGRGDRVAYLGETVLEGFELFHAVPRLGAMLVPLNERLAQPELTKIVASVEPSVIVHGSAFGPLAGRLAESHPMPSVAFGPETADYEDLLRSGDPGDPGVTVDPGSAASICFTSGTTGSPKGVMMGHRAQIEFARGQTIIEPIRPGARHLFARSLSVAPGHRMAAWHGLNGGATILMPRFSPDAFFDLVDAEGATNVLLSPTVLRMLLDHANPDGHDLSSLRTIVYGGAPMPADLMAEVLEFFACDLLQGYGSSEGGQILYLSGEDHRAGRRDSNGRPVPGVKVDVRDPDGTSATSAVAGELFVRSPQLMLGYWRDEARTQAAMHDGWYATGDLCEPQPGGRYRLVGRASDMIISGGFNVMPSEVETTLAGHPAVREVVVFGVPDRTWGEVVAAAVVCVEGATVTAEELIEHCRAELASFKKPRIVRFVDALPLTSVGKTDRAALVRAEVGSRNQGQGDQPRAAANSSISA